MTAHDQLLMLALVAADRRDRETRHGAPRRRVPKRIVNAARRRLHRPAFA